MSKVYAWQINSQEYSIRHDMSAMHWFSICKLFPKKGTWTFFKSHLILGAGYLQFKTEQMYLSFSEVQLKTTIMWTMPQKSNSSLFSPWYNIPNCTMPTPRTTMNSIFWKICYWHWNEESQKSWEPLFYVIHILFYPFYLYI